MTTASALVPVLPMGPIGGGVGSARDDCRRLCCGDRAAIGLRLIWLVPSMLSHWAPRWGYSDSAVRFSLWSCRT